MGYVLGALTSATQQPSPQNQRAEFDRQTLAMISTKSNALISGTYSMTTWLPGNPAQVHELFLTVSNGIPIFSPTNAGHRNGMADTFTVNGKVVSWHMEGIFYEGNAEFVGLIDGNEMWGRVYGWNPGTEEIGIWRLSPK